MIKSLLLSAGLVLFSAAAHSSISIAQSASDENPQTIDQTNLKNLYGDWVFKGGFKDTTFSAINPAYKIAQGDSLLVQLWGGVNFQETIIVDPRGNIFIPKVGPINVLGVSNSDLNDVINKSIQRVYKANVEAYVSLVSSQKVKIFLSGLVQKPGLYEGQSADSIFRFIDLAGGVRRDIGSMRHIQVKRNNQIKYNIDLYAFLQRGELPVMQLQDGDVIFVGPKRGEVEIEGEVGFQGKYEIKESTANLDNIMSAVIANDKATHITIIEPQHNKLVSAAVKEITAQQYPINSTQLADIEVEAGALIKVSSQLKPTSISVDVLGEHDSEFEMVLPWGASLEDLLNRVEFNKLSNDKAIQLFRKSVAKRQKEMLNASLSSLEQTVLTTRSDSTEAAQLREAEANTILQWIEKARQVQPKGQVLLSEGYEPAKIILQQGDQVVIPSKRNLVMVHGEVLFPTAIAFKEKMSVKELIGKAGGATADWDEMNILLQKPNGDFVKIDNGNLKEKNLVKAGDEIFVLAKPDMKEWQLTKDIFQVIYQIAVSAAVVVGL
ncbi:polysaccharide biosynthesis/export family protein [Thalassotalea ponticola]|uniref:polysaccharide biosynthesis/export family protein n=1 Tax=Thalassotalea ponticola TaxID=1523392 RepID=UPI0025B4FD01|nr:polysaccharide biosynthesis/export family protein [Thalassotalea ponticola]MDN3651814.1 polysaccharide biosynthesis/export family protein [Thalassotalea ponticola]